MDTDATSTVSRAKLQAVFAAVTEETFRAADTKAAVDATAFGA